ncbi:aminotransferase class I/II-fold pyridoxal phosphate-dependent enzyme [Spirochaeta dissipatitropha]
MKAKKKESFIDLSNSSFVGCGWRPPLEQIQNGFQSYLQNPDYNPDPAGDQAVRECLSRYYANRKLDMPAENFILTAGTSEAFRLVLLATTEPGQEVLLPLPSYPLFEDIIRLHGRIPRFYELRYDYENTCTWRLCVESVKDVLGPESRLLVIVSPNNPTGWTASRYELEELIPSCKEFNLSLIWDEVFAEYNRDESIDAATPQVFIQAGIPLYILGGISKPFLAPELKLGWLSSSETGECFERMLLINDLFLTVSSPVQHCVPALFEMQSFPAVEVKKHTSIVLDILGSLLPEDIQILHPSGGIHAMIRAGQSDQDDETRSLHWLEQTDTAVQPAYLYGMDDHSQGKYPHWVISLIVPLELQKKAWMRLSLIEAKAKNQGT